MSTAPETPLYLVFSEPPPSVDDETFQEWYETHLSEILETPGFVSVQRYRLRSIKAQSSDEARYRYLIVWQVSEDIDTLRAELARRGDAGEMTFPEWFSDVRYMTWSCEPFGPRLGADAESAVSA
jgi:hypothetical protein